MDLLGSSCEGKKYELLVLWRWGRWRASHQPGGQGVPHTGDLLEEHLPGDQLKHQGDGEIEAVGHLQVHRVDGGADRQAVYLVK